MHTLPNNNVICNLQFGFRQQYSTSHASYNITENIRKALDDGTTSCGISVDSQKAFNTIDCQIVLAKLNHSGICGVWNDWFKSYLSNHNQYVYINWYESDLAVINHVIPQRFYVWATLTKTLNKLVNADLEHLVNWLNANKISLNVKKLKW